MSFGITGVGFGAGGGGGSAISTTGVLPVPPATPPRLPATGLGGSALVDEIIESRRAGGTLDAIALMCSGTLFGFDVLSINSIRVDRVGDVSEFEAGRIVFLTSAGAASAGGNGIKVIASSVLCVSRCAS